MSALRDMLASEFTASFSAADLKYDEEVLKASVDGYEMIAIEQVRHCLLFFRTRCFSGFLHAVRSTCPHLSFRSCAVSEFFANSKNDLETICVQRLENPVG